jgi:hypothetical protein
MGKLKLKCVGGTNLSASLHISFNCYNKANIESSRNVSGEPDIWLGGIAGCPRINTVADGPVTIDKCFATGTVKVLGTTANSNAHAGGIVGRIYGRTDGVNGVTTPLRIYSAQSGTRTTNNNFAYDGILVNGATVTSNNANLGQG